MDLFAEEKRTTSDHFNENAEESFYSAASDFWLQPYGISNDLPADNTGNEATSNGMNFAAFAEKSGIFNSNKTTEAYEFNYTDTFKDNDVEHPSILKKETNNITLSKRNVHFEFPVATTRYYTSDDDNESTASTELLFSDDEELQHTTTDAIHIDDQEVPVNEVKQEPSNKRIKLDDQQDLKFIPTFSFPAVLSIPALDMNTFPSNQSNSLTETKGDRKQSCHQNDSSSSPSESGKLSSTTEQENVTIISETPPIKSVEACEQAYTDVVSPILTKIDLPIDELAAPADESSRENAILQDNMPSTCIYDIKSQGTEYGRILVDQDQTIPDSQSSVVASIMDKLVSYAIKKTDDLSVEKTQPNFHVNIIEKADEIIADRKEKAADPLQDTKLLDSTAMQISEKLDVILSEVKEEIKTTEEYAKVEQEMLMPNVFTDTKGADAKGTVNNTEDNNQPTITNEFQDGQQKLFDSQSETHSLKRQDEQVDISFTTDNSTCSGQQERIGNSRPDQPEPEASVHDNETTSNTNMADKIVLLDTAMKNEEHVPHTNAGSEDSADLKDNYMASSKQTVDKANVVDTLPEHCINAHQQHIILNSPEQFMTEKAVSQQLDSPLHDAEDFRLNSPEEADGLHGQVVSCIKDDGSIVSCSVAGAVNPSMASLKAGLQRAPASHNAVPTAAADECTSNGSVRHPHLCSSMFHLDEGALLTEITLSPLKITDSPNKIWLAQQAVDYDDDTSFYDEDASYNHDKWPLIPSLQCTLTNNLEEPALTPINLDTPLQKEYFQYADIDTESCCSQISVSDFTPSNHVTQMQPQSYTLEAKQRPEQDTKDRDKNDYMQDNLEAQLKYADDLDGPELLHLAMQLVETALKKTKKPEKDKYMHQPAQTVPVITPKAPSPAFTWKKFTYQSQCNISASHDKQNEQDAIIVPDAPKQFNQFSKLYLNNSCTRPMRLGLSRRHKGITSLRYQPYANSRSSSIALKTECQKVPNMEEELQDDFWK